MIMMVGLVLSQNVFITDNYDFLVKSLLFYRVAYQCVNDVTPLINNLICEKIIPLLH